MTTDDTATVKRRIVTIYRPVSIDVIAKILRDVADHYPDAWMTNARSSYDVWTTEPLSNVPEATLTPQQHASPKQDRNQALLDDYHAGATSGELSDKYGITRQRVSQILIAAGEDPGAELMNRHAARREAKRKERVTTCRVCGNQFEPQGSRRAVCSDVCSDAWRLGRKYLDPDGYEKHRRYVGATKPPNRRYARRNSAVVRALLAVGRSDVLPPIKAPEPLNPPCAATNRNGMACSRHASTGDELCHIHRAISDGNPIHLRRPAS